MPFEVAELHDCSCQVHGSYNAIYLRLDYHANDALTSN